MAAAERLHKPSSHNEVFKAMLKETADLIKGSDGITYDKIKASLVTKYGEADFKEMKPFVQGILYKTGKRPGSANRESKRPREPQFAMKSSIAHVVNAVCNLDSRSKSKNGAALEQVWAKLAVSSSARDFERRNSTTAGFSADPFLLPPTSLFCRSMSKADEAALISLTVLLESFDQIAREQSRLPQRPEAAELAQELHRYVDQSRSLVGLINSRIEKLIDRIGGSEANGVKRHSLLWRAPTKGDDMTLKSSFQGAIIDSRYVLKKFLASGSYKTCWKAQDLKTDQPVCLAVPKGAHEAAGFRRELEDGVSEELAVSRVMLCTGLKHVGMVNILDVTEAGKPKTVRLRNGIRSRIHFIVMDLCVADLHAYLGFEKGEMPEPLSRYFFRELLTCMNYLHKKNRFHLDIKLDNVMVVFTDSTFRLKLIDFTRMTNGSSPIVVNTRMGLNAHCAPEARPKGAEYDGAKQDIWSCGRLLLRMVTPVQQMAEIQHFADDKPIAQILHHLQSVGIHFSKELNQFFLQLMATDPSKRATAEEALQLAWLRDNDVPMSGPAVVAEMERRSPLNRTESQTQAVEWDRATPIPSVLRIIEKFVNEMGKTCTVKNQVIVEYAERSDSGSMQTITVVCEVQHKRVLIDTNLEEWVCADPVEGWKEFDVPEHGRTAWMHNKTKKTQWDRPQYSEVFGTRVMIRWKLGSAASLWLAFVAKVGGGLHRIYCDLAAVKSSMRRTVIDVLKKLRCVLLSGYLIKSNKTHNADAVSSTIAAIGRLLAYKRKLEQLTLTDGNEDSEDMQLMEHISVVLSAEGTAPDRNQVARRISWQLEGGGVSQGAFQLLTRDQSSLASAFQSSTKEPMTRHESEDRAVFLLAANDSEMLGPVKKLLGGLNKLKREPSMYQQLDRTKFPVRLRPCPHRNRLIWLHQVLVQLADALPFDDGKARSFIEFLPETEAELSSESLFAPNIEWSLMDPVYDELQPNTSEERVSTVNESPVAPTKGEAVVKPTAVAPEESDSEEEEEPAELEDGFALFC